MLLILGVALVVMSGLDAALVLYQLHRRSVVWSFEYHCVYTDMFHKGDTKD